MSSIYDQLHRRRASRRQSNETETVRHHDLDPKRLCLVDGVAVTAAGILQTNRALPESPPAFSCPALLNEHGFPRLIKAVPTLSQVDSSARLNGLWQLLSGSLGQLKQSIPEQQGVDLVVTVPVHFSPASRQTLQEELIEQLSHCQLWHATQSQCVFHRGTNINTLLAADPVHGGMRWVIWCCLDSLIDSARLQELQESVPERVLEMPGEGGALLLCERLPAETSLPLRGRYWVETLQQQHAEAASHRGMAETPRVHALQALIASLVGARVEQLPCWCVLDSGVETRTASVATALYAQQMVAAAANRLSIDEYCGWPGDAISGLLAVTALTLMQPDESALLLQLIEESSSQVTLLTPVIAPTPDQE